MRIHVATNSKLSNFLACFLIAIKLDSSRVISDETEPSRYTGKLIHLPSPKPITLTPKQAVNPKTLNPIWSAIWGPQGSTIQSLLLRFRSHFLVLFVPPQLAQATSTPILVSTAVLLTPGFTFHNVIALLSGILFEFSFVSFSLL